MSREGCTERGHHAARFCRYQEGVLTFLEPIALIVVRWRLKRRHRIRGCPEHKALAWKSYWPMQWLPEAWRCLRPAPRCRLVSRVAAGRPDQDAGRKVCSAGRHPVRIVLLI